MSLIVRQDDALLEKLTRDIFNQKNQSQKSFDKKISWNIKDFLSNPISLRQRLIRETFFQITGNILGLTTNHIRKIVRLFEFPNVGKTLHMPKNIKVTCSYDSVVFKQENKNFPRKAFNENKSFQIEAIERWSGNNRTYTYDFFDNSKKSLKEIFEKEIEGKKTNRNGSTQKCIFRSYGIRNINKIENN